MLDVLIRPRIPSDMNLDYDPEHCTRFPFFFSHKIRIESGSRFCRYLAFSKDKEKFRTEGAINHSNAELSRS